MNSRGASPRLLVIPGAEEPPALVAPGPERRPLVPSAGLEARSHPLIAVRYQIDECAVQSVQPWPHGPRQPRNCLRHHFAGTPTFLSTASVTDPHWLDPPVVVQRICHSNCSVILSPLVMESLVGSAPWVVRAGFAPIGSQKALNDVVGCWLVGS